MTIHRKTRIDPQNAMMFQFRLFKSSLCNPLFRQNTDHVRQLANIEDFLCSKFSKKSFKFTNIRNKKFYTQSSMQTSLRFPPKRVCFALKKARPFMDTRKN